MGSTVRVSRRGTLRPLLEARLALNSSYSAAMRPFPFVAASLVTVLASCATTGTPTQTPFNFTGDWSGLSVSRSARGQATMNLTQKDAGVTGSLVLPTREILTVNGAVTNDLLKVSGTTQVQDGATTASCAFDLKALAEPRNDSLQVNVKFKTPCPADYLTMSGELNIIMFR